MRIMRKPELKPKVGYSSMQIDRLEAAGRFPKRIVLGPKAVGWLESEIDEWILARAAERGQVPKALGPQRTKALTTDEADIDAPLAERKRRSSNEAPQ